MKHQNIWLCSDYKTFNSLSEFAKIWGFYFKLNTALRFSALRNTALGNIDLVNRIIAL